MPAGGAEPEALQALLRDLARVDLRETKGPHASRAKLREQLRQTGPAILDERAQRHDLRPPRSALRVKEVGLDSLVGGDGESCDFFFSCREGLDRALPANLRISLSKETIRREIVDRHRNHEPPCLPHIVRFTFQDVVCQKRLLDISACAEQLAGG